MFSVELTALHLGSEEMQYQIKTLQNLINETEEVLHNLDQDLELFRVRNAVRSLLDQEIWEKLIYINLTDTLISIAEHYRRTEENICEYGERGGLHGAGGIYGGAITGGGSWVALEEPGAEVLTFDYIR